MLRVFESRDAGCLAGIRSDRALQHLILANPEDKAAGNPLLEAETWAERRQQAGLFRIIADHSGQAIGFAQIANIHRKNRYGWLGIALEDTARGRGEGRAALEEIHQLAVAELGMRKLLLEVRADNRPAIKLYESAGYRQVGMFLAHYDDGVKRHDVALYECLLDRR